MSRIFQSKSVQFPKRHATRVLTVCVVDPQTGDYAAWSREAQASGVRIEFCVDAASALRMAREQHVDLWVINSQLSDLSGIELCTMLKSGGAKANVYVVANEYDIRLEQAAWQARATMFTCKPGHQDLLRHRIADTARPLPVARRGGPQASFG